MSEAAAALLGDNGSAEAGAATTSAAPATGSWNAGLDPDTSAYVQNKGWQSPSDVLNSYRNLEKFAGGSKNLVELPGADADASVMDNFYKKLGRPESPDKYDLKVPETGDKGLADWFKQTAHQSGLSEKQASTLFDAWNTMSGERMKAMQESAQIESERGIGELKKEWGQTYDKQIDAGKRAVAALGYDSAKLNALEDKMGTSEMLRLFATLGSKMGEDSFEGSDRSGSSFGLTPAAARQQIGDLKLDKSFMSQYLNGNPEALSKMKRLMEAAHG